MLTWLKNLFRRKNDGPFQLADQPLLCKNYPRQIGNNPGYNVYWEVFVDGGNWRVNILAYEDGALAETKRGMEETRELAFKEAHQWIRDTMKNYLVYGDEV